MTQHFNTPKTTNIWQEESHHKSEEEKESKQIAFSEAGDLVMTPQCGHLAQQTQETLPDGLGEKEAGKKESD